METKNDDSIKIGGYGGADGVCEIKRLTHEEIDLVQGSIRGGHHWIRRGSDGRLEHVPSYEPLPSPIEDEEMLPFWQRPVEENVPVQLALHTHFPSHAHSSPSITIQHLCGYNYSKENYIAEAKRLQSYGFICLRSRRGDDGQFWEIWFLPGLWMAQGDLKDATKQYSSEGKQATAALEFLRTNASFGTLDVSTQRLAQRAAD